MSTTVERTVTLPVEQVRFIDDLIASGSYASASEVVRAGLRALQEHDGAMERWMREEVVPVYDAMQADPSRGLSAEQVASALRAHHIARLVKDGRDA